MNELNEMLENSVYFGIFLSLAMYGVGVLMKRKWKLAIFNPLLVSIVLTIAVLVILQVDYEVYYEGGRYLSYLLTPATVCLAIPLYEQLEILRHNWRAVVIGILSGVLSSLGSVCAMSFCFGLTRQEYVTLLPKSITTAIGMSVAEELGGYASIAVAAIVVTGILGNVMAETICRMFRIEEPVAKGLAIGTASHAMGTAKAMELGKAEGAMSSLSIVVAGLITVVGASVFANLM